MTETDARQATLSVDSWAFEVSELPRVLPDGWTHFAVIAVGLEAHLDGVATVDPDPDGAVPSDRHRYDATVTTDTINHELVRIVDTASTDNETNATADDKANAAGDDEANGVANPDTGDTEADADGEATTEAFDVSDALDRL